MKKYLLIMMFILLTSSLTSAQNKVNEYLKIAAENNAVLKEKFAEYLAALERVPQVKTLPDPQIAFAYFILPVETRVGPQQARISASQLFPWFGTLDNRERLELEQAKAKYELVEEQKAKLFKEVKAQYFTLYLNQRAIQITKENLNILNSFQPLTRIKVESGQVSLVDEYRVEMEINDLINQLALLEDKHVYLEEAFFNLLNTETTIALPDELDNDDILIAKKTILDSIRVRNHQLLNLELQQSALEYRQNLAELMGKPNISLGVDYTLIGKGDLNAPGNDAFVFPKIGISIPIYRDKYKAMVNEVVHLQEAKAAQIEEKENLLETLFEKVWFEYKDADRRIDLYKQQAELAEKSINILETEYVAGKKNLEEVLRMERKVLKYNLEMEKALADKQVSIAYIHYLMAK